MDRIDEDKAEPSTVTEKIQDIFVVLVFVCLVSLLWLSFGVGACRVLLLVLSLLLSLW